MSKMNAEKPKTALDMDAVMAWWKKLGVMDQLAIWKESATARPEIMDLPLEPQVREMFIFHFKLQLDDPEERQKRAALIKKELEDCTDMLAIGDWWERLSKSERNSLLKTWVPKRYLEITLGAEVTFGDILKVHSKMNKK